SHDTTICSDHSPDWYPAGGACAPGHHTPRLGCYVHQDEIMDLAASCVAFLTVHGVVRGTAIADALFPQSTRGFLEGGVATQEMLAKMPEGLTAGAVRPVTATAPQVRPHCP